MSKKLDPRVRRTRKFLKDALMELIPQKGYNAITIQDITDHALLNRTTFYMHYKDKDDLLQNAVEEVLSEFEQLYQQAPQASDTGYILHILTQVFEHVKAHDDFYTVMLGERSIAPFTRQMIQKIEDIVHRWIPADEWPETRIQSEVFVSFVSSGFLGVVRWWIKHEMPHPPAVMAQQMMVLIVAGIHMEVGLSLDELNP